MFLIIFVVYESYFKIITMGVATASALVGTGLSAYQTIKGASDKKKAERAMNNYERQELVNPYEDIQILTRGTDIMREQADKTTASLVEAARGGGIRGVHSMLPAIQANSNKINQDIAMDLENQEKRRQELIARGDERLTLIKYVLSS